MDSKARSAIMSSIRKKDTRPELAVRRFLHQQGLRYRLHARSLPGNPDLVLARSRSVVFVHGCFWHRCPNCPAGKKTVRTNSDYWLPKLERNQARDKRVQAELTAAGWNVLVIWECETKDLAALRGLAARLKDLEKAQIG